MKHDSARVRVILTLIVLSTAPPALSGVSAQFDPMARAPELIAGSGGAPSDTVSQAMEVASTNRSEVRSPLVARTLENWGPAADLVARLDSLSGSDEAAGDRRWIRPGPTNVVPGRLGAVLMTLAGANTGIFYMEKDRWWSQPGVRFHFKTETGYARDFDKMGHFVGTDFHALLIARAFAWSGVSRKRSALLGSTIGLAMQTYVEINDGYYPMWGFDLLDETANTLGAAWFYLRETSEAARRFDIRWSYWARPIRKHAHTMPEEMINSFTNNYNGQGYWVAARVHDLLPESARSWWPRALMLSAGLYLDRWVGGEFAEQMNRPEAPGQVSAYLSLDLDWQAILRQDTHGGRFLSDLLNRTHLPAPALRLAPRPQFFLVFFGQ